MMQKISSAHSGLLVKPVAMCVVCYDPNYYACNPSISQVTKILDQKHICQYACGSILIMYLDKCLHCPRNKGDLSKPAPPCREFPPSFWLRPQGPGSPYLHSSPEYMFLLSTSSEKTSLSPCRSCCRRSNQMASYSTVHQ